MCDPVSIGMAVFGTLSAVAGHQQASNQAKLQTQMHQMNQASALRDMQLQYADSGIREQQERQAAAEQVQGRRRMALIEAGSASAAIGESGAAGLTMGALMREVMGQAGRDVTSINTNRDWTAGQLGRDREGIRSSGISRMHSTAPGVGPSRLATALRIGSVGLDAYSYHKSLK
jgi:hypothetical protein